MSLSDKLQKRFGLYLEDGNFSQWLEKDFSTLEMFNCINTLNISYHFERCGSLSREQLMRGISIPGSDMYNRGFWLTIHDANKLIQNAQDLSPHYTIEDWQRVGADIIINRALNIFLKVVTKLPTNDGFRAEKLNTVYPSLGQ